MLDQNYLSDYQIAETACVIDRSISNCEITIPILVCMYLG